MNQSCCTVLKIDHSPCRGEQIRDAVASCAGEYIFFASDSEEIPAESELNRWVRIGRRKKADLVMPLPESPVGDTVFFDLQNFPWSFSFCPVVDGKLFRTSAIKNFLETPFEADWLHSPLPDIFLFLGMSARVCGIRDAGRFPDSCRGCIRNWTEEKTWLRNLPGSMGNGLSLSRKLWAWECSLIEAAVELNFPNEEILPAFEPSSVANLFFRKHPGRLACFRFPGKKFRPGPVRRLGVFCWRLSTGGAERCASLMLQEFANWPDLEVILFQTKPIQPTDYPCPANVRRVILPKDFTERMAAEENLLREMRIDTCIYFDHILEMTMFDILLANCLGIRTVSMEHSTFSYLYYEGVPEMCNLRNAVYPVADFVTCLSRADALFWSSQGINARYIPNPLTFDPAGKPVHERKNKTLIFIARMTREKGAEDVLHVLDRVRCSHPDVQLLMVGAFPVPEYEKTLRDLVRDRKLENSIRFIGFTADIELYLEQASVHLLPSVVEGFSMTLMEAKAYGIPTVSYSMPYLEAAREEYGCLVVGKRDIQGMAQAVSDLLADFPHLNELGRKARESLQFFGSDRVYRRWKLLFRTLETGVEPEALSEPPFSPEEAIRCMKIQDSEIICGIDYMLSSAVFLEKMKKGIVQQWKQENPIFSMACKLDLFADGLPPRDGQKGGVLYHGGRILFKGMSGVFLGLRRIYRFFVPWKDAEDRDS